MADKKISQLTAASTPLAGTEVLPIVQSGATVKIAISDVTAGRAVSGTQFTASTGNFIVGTAGKGIDFSANTNAPGMTSELLSWYEEGTFTATITDGTNNATMAASGGRYTRIGRSVFVCGNVSTTSLGSVSGNISISGLPFTIASFAGGSVTYAINLNIAAGNNVQLLANNSGTSLLLFNWDATTGTTWMQASEWTNTGNISLSAMYFV
jgi:hypothetical protein